LISMAIAVLGTGCPKAEAPPEDDRALRILKGEKNRESKGEPMSRPPRPPPQAEDPNARLAEIASGADASEQKLPLPKDNATVHVGTVAVKLLELSTSRVAGSGKIKLSTADAFLRVHLVSQNVGKAVAPLDFALAQVECGESPYPLAPDVTRVAGTRELKRAHGVNEREEVTLYFELPPAALIKGCALVLPAGGPPDVRIRFE
jgi:hypothetical protein